MAKAKVSQAEVKTNVAKRLGASKRDVSDVLSALADEIRDSVGRGRDIVIPGVGKVVVQRKPATKASVRPNPFAPGEMMKVKAKPARNIVKIRPLKAVKDAV